MAARRFSRSRSRSSSSRFRSRMQRPHRPIKWERGNIYLTADHQHEDALVDILSIFVLARPQNIVDADATNEGRAMSEAVRYLEIGGVIYTTSVKAVFADGITIPTQGDVGNIDTRTLLCSDRMDNSVPPQPAALTPNWFTNTGPSTTVKEAQDASTLYPTQIHHQSAKHICIASIPDHLTALPSRHPAVQTTVNGHFTGNVRLKLRLEEDQCLTFHFASHVDTAEDGNAYAVRFTTTGTYFYRWVFR